LIEAPQDTAINDDFAKTLGLESLDKLKEAARDGSRPNLPAPPAAGQADAAGPLDEGHRFEAPPSLVDEEFNLMWNSIKAEMESSGKTFADEDTTEAAARKSTARSPIAGSDSAWCCPRSAKRTRSRSPTMRSAAR